MTLILRQSTSASFYIGPFLDLTAGTAEESLTIDATEVWLSKNGGAYANKNEATAVVHSRSGMYLLVLDSADTGTVGTLSILVDDTANAAIPVAVHCQVIETDIYDALYANGADGFNSSGQVSLLTATQDSIDAIEADTGTTLNDKIDAIDTVMDAILVDTGTTLDDKIDTIDDFLDTELAAITTAVVTVSGEPAQGAPPVSASLQTKVNYLYKAFRNKLTQTSTQFSIYNDAGAVIDHKSTVSDDGTTLTRGEIETGP